MSIDPTKVAAGKCFINDGTICRVERIKGGEVTYRNYVKAESGFALSLPLVAPIGMFARDVEDEVRCPPQSE